MEQGDQFQKKFEISETLKKLPADFVDKYKT
jgi:hypothetical protein